MNHKMEFKTTSTYENGQIKTNYYINEKLVDEHTYYTLIEDSYEKPKNIVSNVKSMPKAKTHNNEEFIEDEEHSCPVCDCTNDILDYVFEDGKDDDPETFCETINGMVSELFDIGYNIGHIEALVSVSNGIADALERFVEGGEVED